MSIEIIGYTPAHETLWDAWCTDAGNATLLHTRNFLNYHGDRFEDVSVLLYDSGKLVGVMPAARDLHDTQLVISHPGATYGGIVHQRTLKGERVIQAFECLKTYYHGMGFEKLLYKPLPHIYATVPSQDDLYALFRHSARRVRCELSSAIDLSARRPPSERRRRGYKKAQKSVTISSSTDLLADLWDVLTGNLERKHDTGPVHSLNEMMNLMMIFPESIRLRCAMVNGRVEAGVILFNSTNVWHAQYIASSETGYAVSALDAIFEYVIDEARNASARYFDFGTSNGEGDWLLNDGLYCFKSEFGGGGVAHEFYELVM